MKTLIALTAALLLSGCSNPKLATSSFNLGMSMIAPGSYSVAYSSGKQIFKQVDTAYNKYIASDNSNQ
jgi:uncharacterized lipoprotein YmbA